MRYIKNKMVLELSELGLHLIDHAENLKNAGKLDQAEGVLDCLKIIAKYIDNIEKP